MGSRPLTRFIGYIGIAYQLPGAFAGERANLLSSHLKAMGLLDSARIMFVAQDLNLNNSYSQLCSSWHVSISLAYLPAWIIVSIVWHHRIFTATNVGLVIIIHLLLGFTLASWSFFIAVPFGKSPQLAAVASTFLSIMFAVAALVFSHASTGAAFVFSIIFPPGFYIFVIRAMCGFENHQIGTNILDGDPDNGVVVLPIVVAAIVSRMFKLCDFEVLNSADRHLLVAIPSRFTRTRAIRCP
jgi:ATP-binding cassette, subfamily A (ABC1), member 3